MTLRSRATLPWPVLAAPWAPTGVLLMAYVVQTTSVLPLSIDTSSAVITWAISTAVAALMAYGLALAQVPREPEDQAILREAMATLAQAEQLALQATRPNASAAPASSKAMPRLAMGIAFVLLAATATAIFMALPVDDVPTIMGSTHDHATFAVFAYGERVAFHDERFDLSARGHLQAHLHAPDGELMHLEGEPGMALGEFFALALDATLGRDVLRLDDAVHGGVSLPDERGGTLRIFAKAATGDWTPVGVDHAIRDGDRILVTIGDARGAELAFQMDAVRAPE